MGKSPESAFRSMFARQWKGILSIAMVAALLSVSALIPARRQAVAASSSTPPATTAAPEPSDAAQGSSAAPATSPQQSAGPSPTEEAFTEITEQIAKQQQIDNDLLAELNTGAYTLDSPLVVVDPYGASPLAALVLFQTSEPTHITVHIPGKTTLANVDFTFDGYETSHMIPVYGLYANRMNEVTITATTQGGAVKSVKAEIKTDAMPVDLATMTAVVSLPNEAAYQPGFNFICTAADTPQHAIDANGDVRWYLMGRQVVYSYNKGAGLYALQERYLVCKNLLGKILAVYSSGSIVNHDAFLTGRGTVIVDGNSKETIEDRLFEIDLATGGIVRQLDYKTILQRTRGFGVFVSNVDWMHMNAVVEYKGNVIVSSRHQSTVVCNTWDGTIKWMLCDPTGYLAMYRSYILKPVGEPFEYPYNQHAVEVMPDQDGNPDTLDILLFDNGDSRNAVDADLMRRVANHEIVEPPLYSRMVQYRIDEKKGTVRQVWRYGQDRPELYALRVGDANLLANGDRLGFFLQETGAEGTSGYRASADLNEVTAAGGLVW